MLRRRRPLCFFAVHSARRRRGCGGDAEPRRGVRPACIAARIGGGWSAAACHATRGSATTQWAPLQRTHSGDDDEAALRGGEVIGSPFVLAANDDGNAAASALAGNDGTEEAQVRATLRAPPSVPVVITVARERERAGLAGSAALAAPPMTATSAGLGRRSVGRDTLRDGRFRGCCSGVHGLLPLYRSREPIGGSERSCLWSVGTTM
ncbi:hypothetical protein MTO96_038864 [Rhipicephalus appendiculatus]